MNEIVLLPIGSYEQHGPFLPHETDSIICEYITKKLSELIPNTICLPIFSYGLSVEHLDVGHSITFSINTYMNVLQELLKSVSDAYKNSKLIVLINGHGGNQDIASAVCSNWNYLNKNKSIIFHVFPQESREFAKKLLGDFNAHADSVESSVYAAIKNIEDKKIDLNSINEISIPKHSLRLYPVRELSQTGIVTAESEIVFNKEIGKKILDKSIETIYLGIKDYLSIINNKQ